MVYPKSISLPASLSRCFAEYIVGFNNYYTAAARRNFITAALNHSGVIRWKIIPRDNPAKHLPSDFDVLEVTCAIPTQTPPNKRPETSMF